jgi:hypothetical protein
MKLLHNNIARASAVLLAALLAVPGVVSGRGVFVEDYNILDFSPEVRSLRHTQLFMKGGVPVLYTLAVADPAPRFYLADRVHPIDEVELKRLLTQDRPFLCLTFNSIATDFIKKHPQFKVAIVASTESLALMAYR